jgi:hypothetical protein
MPLTLEGDNTSIIKWWVDASFAVHPDMKSHTGGDMSLGKGAVYGTSTRQKLNTKSSTEAELVGVNDGMPQILLTGYFLEAQGYGVKDSIVNQNNQSAILLEKNGCALSSKCTCHINIRYFFVANRVESNEVSIQYCHTGEIIANFFAKPLQGVDFQKFRNFIINYYPTTNSLSDPRSVLGNEDGDWTKVERRTDQKVRLCDERMNQNERSRRSMSSTRKVRSRRSLQIRNTREKADYSTLYVSAIIFKGFPTIKSLGSFG